MCHFDFKFVAFDFSNNNFDFQSLSRLISKIWRVWFLKWHFWFPKFIAFDFSNDTFDFQNLSRLISQMTLLISKICLRSRKPKLYGDIKSSYSHITAAMEKLLYFCVDISHKRATNSTGIRASKIVCWTFKRFCSTYTIFRCCT